MDPLAKPVVSTAPAGAARPASRVLAWGGLALFALFALVPSASASFTLQTLEGSVLERATAPVDESRVFEFTFRFMLDDDERLDFVVVPERENPVYDNGDPALGGWWTEVRAYDEEEVQEDPEEMPDFEPTNGSDAVELGRLDDDVPLTLQVRVHVPADALSSVTVWKLSYRLQEHDSWSVFGDEEPAVRDLHAVISVHEDAETQGGAGPQAVVPPQTWNAPQVALVVGSAFLALGLITMFGGRPQG